MIENKVKLVVWDLDETFWRGTLTEGGITHIESNVAMVRELSTRGIINSICSKNDYEQVKEKLSECGIWEYFVFPSISFNPKGKAIAEMIEGAALRPQNVLFLDDNPSNLEEAKFFNPGIMTANPVDVLEGLLDHPHLEGKPDPELTRLKQYQFLQRKVEVRDTSALSNEEFLRASNIRVTIDHDVAPNFDRVIELINRTNQLNYTKVRLETDEAVEELRDAVTNGRNINTGTVHVVDSYGDYGLVGFYFGTRRAGMNSLAHFVFSCRTMNMGIEQYVYELLGCPDIKIAKPVSYGLKTHDRVDWINAGDANETSETSGPLNKELVLLGGCDLLQLANYCSTNRSEFVNEQREGAKIRFDDPGFVLTDRSALKTHPAMGRFNWWTHEDAVRFDKALASAQLILLSLWPGMNGRYYRIGEDISVRFTKNVADNIEQDDPEFFAANFTALDLEDDGRLGLIEKSFDSIAARCASDVRIFSLGTYTRGLDNVRGKRRSEYNKACRDYCERHPERFRYVDVDAILPPGALLDDTHFSRAGYFALAQYILAVIRGQEPVLHWKGEHAVEEGAATNPERSDRKDRRARKERQHNKAEKSQMSGDRDAQRTQRREERQKKRAAKRGESAAVAEA